MFSKKLAIVSMFGAAMLLSLGGCPMPWDRTGNQGGSTPLQATTKVLSNNLGALNPDDVQVLADLATQFTGADIPPVTDDQAAAAVTFMQANDIDTFEDIEQTIRDAEEDPDSIVIPDEVLEVLQTIIQNPEAYQNAAEGLQDQFDI